MSASLLSLNLAPNGLVKRPVSSSVEAGPAGLVGDRTIVSIGTELSKAVYAYPSEHFPFWQTVRAQARAAAWDSPLEPGLLGENLTLSGLLENQVWVGDVLRFPACELAVSEPRFPDAGLNTAMGFPHAAKLMAASGWCGFFLAVRVPGRLRAGELFDVVPGPREVGIPELFRACVAADRR